MDNVPCAKPLPTAVTLHTSAANSGNNLPWLLLAVLTLVGGTSVALRRYRTH